MALLRAFFCGGGGRCGQGRWEAKRGTAGRDGAQAFLCSSLSYSFSVARPAHLVARCVCQLGCAAVHAVVRLCQVALDAVEHVTLLLHNVGNVFENIVDLGPGAGVISVERGQGHGGQDWSSFVTLLSKS